MGGFIDGEEFVHVDEDDVLDPDVQAKKADAAAQKKTEALDEALRFLRRRKEAYIRVFAGSASADDVKTVVDDIKTFCRATESTYATNPRDHALLEGRREVWLRIEDHLTVDLDTLFFKYNRKD